MPIVVTLDDMLHARRMTLTELADRIGITLANLSILKTGKARAVQVLNPRGDLRGSAVSARGSARICAFGRSQMKRPRPRSLVH